ncbi:hypothetical protein QL285_046178 [Trifolium repens]|nr:hypothetical protein QL285_046178 [Trifolium repens]
MEVGNNENEQMGDGEVVNAGEDPPICPGLLTARNGEEMLYWEHKVTTRTFDLDFVLEIPQDMRYVFIDSNQEKITIIDRDNGNRYPCEINLNGDEISVGKCWNRFVVCKPLEIGDSIVCVLYDDNPYNIHVILGDRVSWYHLGVVS